MTSIIVSTYNRKSLLKRAINSLLNQSVKDFEIIVVDDCSTDGTQKYVKSIGDPRIKYLKTKKNSGSDSHPKNLGIKEARGEYVAFLDDDDTWRPDALKILEKYIRITNVDLVYGDYLNITRKKKEPGWSIDFSVSTLSKMNYIAMPTVLVRREALLEVGGFDESVPKFKDWNLWLRLQKRGYKLLHIPIIVAEVTSQPDSISKKFKHEVNEDGSYKPTWFNPGDMPIWAKKTLFGEAKPLKVGIFTFTWNRLDYTKQMAESLKTAGYPFKWLILDQGSTDGTVEWLKKENPAQEYIYEKENIGIAEAWNKCAEALKDCDIIIKIDNDAELMTKNWLKLMVEIFERNRNVILSPYVEGLEDSPGGVLRESPNGSPYNLINDRVLGLVPYLGGICWAAPKEVYKDFKFDGAMNLAGNKDYIISQYAKSQGFNLFYLEETRLAHIDGTKGQHEKYPDYFKYQDVKGV